MPVAEPTLSRLSPTATGRRLAAWPGVAVWLLAAPLLLLLDGTLDLANLALLLVLAAALSALWLPPAVLVPVCAGAVMAFNLLFVPPRGRLSVDLHQHALLLLVMLAVSWTVALLMARQRRLADAQRRLAGRADQLRELGDRLRDADDPRQCAGALQVLLSELTGLPASLLLPSADQADNTDHTDHIDRTDALPVIGPADADQHAGLRLTWRQGRPMGPGTGRHEEQPAWYLPLRGRSASHGAALLRLPPRLAEAPAPRHRAAASQPQGPVPPTHALALRAHAQALCDQLGQAIERWSTAQAAAAAGQQAQAQALRNTLLTAVAHDFRTPLAAILGAASSLHDQADRLSAEQRRRLAARIVDESEQLARMTANTLQLAQLDAPGLALRLDWESAEELVGTAVQRLRRRAPAQRLKLHLEPGLPLLRCDAVRMVQLLENLVDNALTHGGDAAPVELQVRRVGDQVVLAVRDRGPGVPPAWRERIFQVFQRGPGDAGGQDAPARRGAGVGLAVCRAIARAHGGELRLRPRGHGGSSFECVLPVLPPPDATPAAQPLDAVPAARPQDAVPAAQRPGALSPTPPPAPQADNPAAAPRPHPP